MPDTLEANAVPIDDASDNPTGCCPGFNPAAWENQQLHFENKFFVRATTRSVFHIPINMGPEHPRKQHARFRP